MSELTIQDLIKAKALLDAQNVPEKGRFIRCTRKQYDTLVSSMNVNCVPSLGATIYIEELNGMQTVIRYPHRG